MHTQSIYLQSTLITNKGVSLIVVILLNLALIHGKLEVGGEGVRKESRKEVFAVQGLEEVASNGDRQIEYQQKPEDRQGHIGHVKQIQPQEDCDISQNNSSPSEPVYKNVE